MKKETRRGGRATKNSEKHLKQRKGVGENKGANAHGKGD